MAFKVIKKNILRTNGDVASKVRDFLCAENILMINIISSPGAGKTSFLERLGPRLQKEAIPFGILTGDCYTTTDADRMDALNLPVIQINTGGACHINAQLVEKSLEEMDLSGVDLVIVENVGNLICPAEFDLGEDLKIAFLSTAEGHDKPMKYPMLIKESPLAIINKTDLIRHVDFDMTFCENCIKEVNPDIEILKISCKTGEGIDEFLTWLKPKINSKKEKMA